MMKAETLRKCILRDAVMGKMSHQRPEDGNAREEQATKQMVHQGKTAFGQNYTGQSEFKTRKPTFIA